MKKLFINILFVLSIIFPYILLSGILVNNIDINTVTTPEKGGIIAVNNSDDNIIIFMDESKIMIYMKSSEGVPFFQDVKNGFKNMQYNKNKFNQYSSLNLFLQEPKLSFEHYYLIGEKSIFLNSSESLSLLDVLLESPNIFLRGDQITICHSFINGNNIELYPNNQNSLISMIKFIFRDKQKYNYLYV